MKSIWIAAIIGGLTMSSGFAAENAKHLFILSGQSNMNRLDPQVSFTPTVEAEFGKDNVIVIKVAQDGVAIQRWYKKWKPVQGDAPIKTGALYDRMMMKVNEAIKGEKLATVTFVWMQGETDALSKQDKVYKESLLGLVKQLSDDLQRDDINYVIGRLSQFKKDENWEGLRKAQVEAAEASPRGAWVDTDDVDIKGIHYTPAGYKELGQRFAAEAIKQIKAQSK